MPLLEFEMVMLARKVFRRVRSLLREGHPRVWSLRVFLNLRRMHKYRTSPYGNNSGLISSILSCFFKKTKFHGNVRTYQIGEHPKQTKLVQPDILTG